MYLKFKTEDGLKKAILACNVLEVAEEIVEATKLGESRKSPKLVRIKTDKGFCLSSTSFDKILDRLNEVIY